MRKILGLAAVALTAACTMYDDSGPARADDEAKLASELRDYEPAGPAVACVSTRNLRGNRSAGEGAIIFEGTSHNLWVNRPAGGCPDLNFGRALQTTTTTSQLCRGDIATVFDPVTGTHYGGCGLGDFTPYKRRPR